MLQLVVFNSFALNILLQIGGFTMKASSLPGAPLNAAGALFVFWFFGPAPQRVPHSAGCCWGQKDFVLYPTTVQDETIIVCYMQVLPLNVVRYNTKSFCSSVFTQKKHKKALNAE